MNASRGPPLGKTQMAKLPLPMIRMALSSSSISTASMIEWM
jgi:hypothetical protein